MSSPRIRQRPDRRTPALAVAFIMAALGVLGIWWSAAALIERQNLAGLEGLEGRTWESLLLILGAGGAVLLGLVLILVALIPGKAAVTPMRVPNVGPERNTVVTTKGSARIVNAEAERTEGTVGVRATGTPGRVKVLVDTVAPNGRDVRNLVSERSRDRFCSLRLKRVPRVAVRTRRKEKR